jgi:hypothetical protein
VRRVAADPFYTTRRKCYILALVQKKDRPHFGDQACLHELARRVWPVGESASPLFFLSDDVGVQRQAYGQFGHRMGRINVKGFLTALTVPGLVERLYLQGGVSREMCADILRQASAAGSRWAEDRPCVDTARPPWEEDDFPFRRAMSALLRTLPPQENVESAVQAVEPPTTSRAEQFRRKWNWG